MPWSNRQRKRKRLWKSSTNGNSCKSFGLSFIYFNKGKIEIRLFFFSSIIFTRFGMTSWQNWPNIMWNDVFLNTTNAEIRVKFIDFSMIITENLKKMRNLWFRNGNNFKHEKSLFQFRQILICWSKSGSDEKIIEISRGKRTY